MRDLAQTVELLVGLRGSVDAPIKGLNTFNPSNEVDDLRDLERKKSRSILEIDMKILRMGAENWLFKDCLESLEKERGVHFFISNPLLNTVISVFLSYCSSCLEISLI